MDSKKEMPNKISPRRKALGSFLGILLCCALFRAGLFGKRIITLAPALTEIVFALGKGDQLVGNTRFCDFPEPARAIPKVGGLMDLNLEKIISLKADMIILYPESLEKVKLLRDQARLLVVKHRTLNQILESIRSVSKILGTEKKGEILVSDIQETLKKIQAQTRNQKRKKTLMIVGRNPDGLRNMTIIGKKDFLNTILEVAGGVNAYSGAIEYPAISIESVAIMDPDCIIEFTAFIGKNQRHEIAGLWRPFSTIPAIKNNRIFLIDDPMWLRPGPRVGEVARELFHILSTK